MLTLGLKENLLADTLADGSVQVVGKGGLGGVAQVIVHADELLDRLTAASGSFLKLLR